MSNWNGRFDRDMPKSWQDTPWADNRPNWKKALWVLATIFAIICVLGVSLYSIASNQPLKENHHDRTYR